MNEFLSTIYSLHYLATVSPNLIYALSLFHPQSLSLTQKNASLDIPENSVAIDETDNTAPKESTFTTSSESLVSSSDAASEVRDVVIFISRYGLLQKTLKIVKKKNKK